MRGPRPHRLTAARRAAPRGGSWGHRSDHTTGVEGDWCALAAGLRCEAGDRVEAGLLYADAGGR
ncbi:hypothetical protein, partial [Streptomyces hirsutus]|uniref:hypothetical protein n=1 Tax=Streptomyces hirsutus TaxID=35620 RepID=UPI0033A5D46E